LKLGFYTACLPEVAIDRVAAFAAEAGFETLEIDLGAHVPDLSVGVKVVEKVRAEGVDVCALTRTGGLLDQEAAAQAETRRGVEQAIRVAAEAGVPVVAGFAGNNAVLSDDENYEELARYLEPVVAQAGDVRLVFENWPGPGNSWRATTPGGWRRLFAAVPAANLGLNLDPSHLVWQGIDHEAALREFAPRVFLAHAKDTEIFPDPLQANGYFSSGWWTYRLPGRGRIDWTSWLSLLRETGFAGGVTIEHEDGDFGAWGGPVEEKQRGLREGLRVLRAALPRS
jgi:sugar phosphate isomerase/epimerase